MANPQPTDSHGIIAHDIQEQLLVRDFSKQQLKIIYLVIRLSWGCGAKAWQYESYRDFEVIGIPKGHIEKNLTRLVNNNIFIWYKKYKILVFNKNYDQWIVEKVNTVDIKKLVHQSLQNGNLVTKLVTDLSYINGNQVTEKAERQKPESLTDESVSDHPIERLIESINTTTAIAENYDSDFEEIGNHFTHLTGRCINSNDCVSITEVLGFGIDLSIVKDVMTKLVKKKKSDTTIRTFKYFVEAIKEEDKKIKAIKSHEGAVENGSEEGEFDYLFTNR